MPLDARHCSMGHRMQSMHSIDSAEGLLSKSYIMLSAHATVFGKHKTNNKSTSTTNSKSKMKLAERVSRISICGCISSVASSCVVYSRASYRCDVLNLPDSIELGTLSLPLCVCVCLWVCRTGVNIIIKPNALSRPLETSRVQER